MRQGPAGPRHGSREDREVGGHPKPWQPSDEFGTLLAFWVSPSFLEDLWGSQFIYVYLHFFSRRLCAHPSGDVFAVVVLSLLALPVIPLNYFLVHLDLAPLCLAWVFP